MAADSENTLIMTLETGPVVIDLRPDLAPAHVAQIKDLAREGFYDGVVFHRVIPGFMAQGGDPTGTGGGGSARPNLKAEFTNSRQFLRGVFVLNPNTPPGLPYGDKAVLAQIDGDSGGLVFFIDGTRACTPMAIPAVLVSMMQDVGAATIPHEAGGL